MKIATVEAVEDLQDIHRGLHAAMDALIRSKDAKKTEEILHQIDQRMTSWIKQTKVAKL